MIDFIIDLYLRIKYYKLDITHENVFNDITALFAPIVKFFLMDYSNIVTVINGKIGETSIAPGGDKNNETMRKCVKEYWNRVIIK